MLSSRQERRFWPFALLALAGCSFSVDADLTKYEGEKDDGDGETADAGIDCARAETAGLRGCGEVDSGMEPPEVSAAKCSQDADCQPAQICESKTCTPRCTAERGCASPQISGLSNFDVAGGKVFWAIFNGVDRLGNPLREGSLWSWDQVEAPVRVPGVTGCDELLFHVNGQLYFLDQGSLFRVASDGSTPPQRLADTVSRAWETTDHRVAWSRSSGASEDLWVVKPDPQEVPEFLGAAPYATSWVASNATHAAWIRWSDTGDAEVTIVKFPDLEVLATFPAVIRRHEPDMVVMDERFVYFPQSGRRVDLQDVANVRNVDSGLGLIASGDLLLWYEPAPTEDQHILMMNDRHAALEPTVMAKPGTQTTKFTISDGAVYYESQGRIFAKSLPTVPCAVDLICPSEMSCGPNRVCVPD